MNRSLEEITRDVRQLLDSMSGLAAEARATLIAKGEDVNTVRIVTDIQVDVKTATVTGSIAHTCVNKYVSNVLREVENA